MLKPRLRDGLLVAFLGGVLFTLVISYSLNILLAPPEKHLETWRTTVDMSSGELISPERDVLHVMSSITWFDDVNHIRAYMHDDEILGGANCEPYLPEFVHCDLYLVRPVEVDDEWVNTVGHELLHGIYGSYHD